MKILAVTPWFPSPLAPGAGIFNLRDVELLARDHEVTVVHLVDPTVMQVPEPSTLPGGISVVPVPFHTLKPFTVIRTARKIGQLAADHDLIHTMAFPALLPVKVARVLSRKASRKPWVHTEHWSGLVTDAPTLRATVGGMVLRPLLRAPDGVVAVGAQLASAIDAYRPSSPATVIPNYVRFGDRELLPETPESRADDPLRLIAVGGAIERKGVLEAVGAVAELSKLGISSQLTWVGDGDLRERAITQAQEHGIADHIEFVGFIAPEQLTTTLRSHHVFLLPTDGETFGVAIAEALAVGLPVVTSGVGGHTDFLPAEASRLVAKEPRALAMAVSDLIVDTHRWTPDKIVQYARQRFSEQTRREQYASVYGRVLLPS